MLARRKMFAQDSCITTARLAQSAERKALNLVVVGLSPTVGVLQKAGLKRQVFPVDTTNKFHAANQFPARHS